jgi:hypothetical protein
MPWVKKRIKKGFFTKDEILFEQVEIVAKRAWQHDYDDWTDAGTEYIVKNKKGEMFITDEIYN